MVLPVHLLLPEPVGFEGSEDLPPAALPSAGEARLSGFPMISKTFRASRAATVQPRSAAVVKSIISNTHRCQQEY
jgi:hypothetical protein